MDTGELEENKRLYDGLFDRKEEIELAFGQPLSWERLDQRRASRLGIYRTGSIDDSAAELRVIEDWMVENLLKFKEIVNPLA